MAGALGGVRASVLLSRVRQLADMETTQSGSSQFVTDEEIKQRIDEAAGELYEMLITSLGEDYFVRDVYAEFLANGDLKGAPVVRLPTDFYRLITVHEVTNLDAMLAGEQPILRPCMPFQRVDMTALLNARPQAHGPFFYRLSARRGRHADEDEQTAETSLLDRLEVWPRPSVDQQFRVAYVPWFATYDAMPEGLTDGTEVRCIDPDPIYPGIMGWEEWVVIKAAIYCKDKEESDSSKLELRLSEQTARIQSHRHKRDVGAPERIALTRKRRKQGWCP